MMKRFRDTEYFITENGDVVRNNNKLKPIIKKGYATVCLYYNSKKNYHLIHRLVAECYLSNPNNLPELDHLDCNKLNNCYSNLEWVTSKENKKRAISNGIYKKGINHKQSVLTDDIVKYIKNNYKHHDRNFGGMALSRKLNISHATISRVINNKNYTND
jgi:hypothetical protein